MRPAPLARVLQENQERNYAVKRRRLSPKAQALFQPVLFFPPRKVPTTMSTEKQTAAVNALQSGIYAESLRLPPFAPRPDFSTAQPLETTTETQEMGSFRKNTPTPPSVSHNRCGYRVVRQQRSTVQPISFWASLHRRRRNAPLIFSKSFPLTVTTFCRDADLHRQGVQR